MERKEKKKEYFREEEILKLMNGIFKGVEHCHNRNIIHRDLKPENILLVKDHPKLCDFALAVDLQDASSIILDKAGTPSYVAPEIWDEGKYGFASDIWALGCIAYQLSTFKQYKLDDYNNIINNTHYSYDLNTLIKMMLNVTSEQRPHINYLNSTHKYYWIYIYIYIETTNHLIQRIGERKLNQGAQYIPTPDDTIIISRPQFCNLFHFYDIFRIYIYGIGEDEEIEVFPKEHHLVERNVKKNTKLYIS